MVTNRTADYLVAHLEIETEGRVARRDISAIPGPIIGEFSSHHDALLFRALKDPNHHCITAGVNQRYAVRRMVRP